VNDYVTTQELIKVAWVLAGALVMYRIVLLGTSQLRRLSSLETDPQRRVRREQRANTIRGMLNNTARVVLLVTAVTMILSIFDLNVTPIVAGAGVVGIALGFGAQSLVRDFLAGLFIIFENQFDIGDEVTLAGHAGTVERVTLRITALRDLEGAVHIVPNGKIEVVVVHSKEWARATVDVTVHYSEEIGRVLELVDRECRAYGEESSDVVIEPPEVLGVDELGPLGPRLRVTVRTRPGKQASVARELRRRIKAAFERDGIRFATHEP
jgi:small-conductance mechanosensitive channel